MKVLIADDHELVRRGVRALLRASVNSPWEVCGEAVDGVDAVQKAQDLKPDIIIMDVSMPNLNGLEATRQVRRMLPQTEVLILSQHESSEIVQQAYNAGARGYVVKSSVSRDLLTALAKITDREPFFAHAPAPLTDGRFDAHEALERAALERALRSSEEQFRSTFELAAIGVGNLDVNGRWVRVNRKLSEILGYDQMELMRLRDQDITHRDDISKTVDLMRSMVKGGCDQGFLEKRYIHKNGSEVWVNLSNSAVRDASGAVNYLISVVEDVTDRRQAEHARFNLAAIVECSTDAIVSKNLNGIITGWNASAERMFGFTPEEAVGKSITLVIPEELRSQEQEILRRLKRGERIEHFETVRVTKHGKRLEVSLTISPVKDAKGNIVGASKIVRDITERKRVEAELKEAQEGTRFSLEVANVGTWDWNLATNEVRWSENLERVHGQAPGSFRGNFESVMEHVHPDDLGRLQQIVKDTLAGDGKYFAQYRQYRADGTICWIEARGQVIRDPAGNPVRMRGICMDITERKATEDALHAVQRTMEQRVIERTALLEQSTRQVLEQAHLLDMANDAILIRTLDGRITYWNQGAERLYGWNSAEVIGKSPVELLQTRFPLPLEEVLKTDRWEGELQQTKRDGAEITVSSHWTALRGADGRPVSWLVINTDITARKLAEDLSRGLTARLLTAQDDERRRIARELHDSLGQYLTVLAMNLGGLASLDDEAQRNSLIEESVQITDQCLLETRTISYLLHPPLLDEAGFVSAAQWFVDGFSTRSGIKADLRLPEQMARLDRMIETVLFRVMQESLTNVHRHSGASAVEIHLDSDQDRVRLRVSDNGRGISKDSPQDVVAPRPGVGLAGMRERVRELGGAFDLQSDERGTTISIEIPLLSRAAASAPLVDALEESNALEENRSA